MHQTSNTLRELLARNTALNIIGKIVPLAIGAVTIPIIIAELGLEQFGILSLVWVLFGYFSLFDIGIGQAATKLIAERIGTENENEISDTVRSALLMSAVLGGVGTVLIVLIAPFLVTRVFNISHELIQVAKIAFYLIAAGAPLATLIGTARGALEGKGRYDIINGIKIPINSLVFLIPTLAGKIGMNIQDIVALLVALQFVTLIAYLFFCGKIFSLWKIRSRIQKIRMSRLFLFGKWAAISNSSLAFLANIDRFLISALVSVKAVGFYTAPFDMVTKLFALPESLIPLFPAFSALGANQSKHAGALYARSAKHLLTVSGVIVIFIIVYAKDILRIWLGEEFAEMSASVLQFISVAVLAVSLSLLGEYLFNGLGRPDIVAKLRMVELPLYLAGAWFGIREFGILGAALAWTIRAVFDTVLLFLLIPPTFSIPLSTLMRGGIAQSIICLLLLGSSLMLAKTVINGPSLYISTTALLLIFGILWKHLVLDKHDKIFLSVVMKKFFK